MGYSNNGNSLSELEHEADSTRAKLVQTVDELHDRVSPQALKREAKDYVRQTSRNFLNNLESKAIDNPVAAIAVMAGLTIPVLKIVSSIPVPVLLMGAGLAMSGQSRGNSSPRNLRRYDHDEGSVVENISNAASSIADKTRQVIHDTKDSIEDMGSSAKDSINEQISAVRRLASDTASSASAVASDLSHRTSRAVANSQEQIVQGYERQPLLVSGAVFVLGGLLASLLPRSRSEDRLMGGMSDQVKDRAKDMAAEGSQKLEKVAEDTAGAIASEVREEGLTPDVARHAVRTVANKANTALDETLPSPEPGSRKRSL